MCRNIKVNTVLDVFLNIYRDTQLTSRRAFAYSRPAMSLRVSPPDPTFEDHAERVLARLRDVFAQIMDALRAKGIQRTDLHKALALDRTLAWKILKVAHGGDLFTMAPHVPGPASIRAFLAAAAKHGVSDELITSARRALADHEELIETHAGDRASLDIMAAGFAKRGRTTTELSHRKAAVRANSYLWGVHAETQLKAYMIWPGSAPGRLDFASLGGFVELRRMRPNMCWVVSRSRCTDNDGQVRHAFKPEPLDPRGAAGGDGGVPLLVDFCSRPLPQFRRRATGVDGMLEDELVEGPVGKCGAVTCMAGEIVRNVASYYRDEHNEFCECVLFARTPCDALVLDLLVHEDLFPGVRPELAVYSELEGGPSYPARGRSGGRLMLPETTELLGRGPAVMHTPSVPRYAEMVRYALGRLDWDGDRLLVHRVHIPAPPIPTAVVVRYALPEPA